MLDRLVYASRSLIRAHSPEMLDVVRAALRDNPRHGICGALYFDDAQFFQVIEGSAASIDGLWGKLLRDPRHHDVALLRREPIGERLFGAWSMKFHDGALIGEQRISFAYERLRAADPERLAAKIEALRLL